LEKLSSATCKSRQMKLIGTQPIRNYCNCTVRSRRQHWRQFDNPKANRNRFAKASLRPFEPVLTGKQNGQRGQIPPMDVLYIEKLRLATRPCDTTKITRCLESQPRT
jgi:hypothetical protein